jgi:hypothetical protein
MEFDAITFDTQVVQTNSFDFNGGLLDKLKQFKDGPTRVVVSTIVVTEIRKHLRAKIIEVRDGLETAHRRAVSYDLKPNGDAAFSAPIDPDAIAKQRLAEFFLAIGAEAAKYDDVALGDVVKRYFEGTAPFGGTKKKAEFPDAIALLSLEKWAEVNDAKILAVSGDKDWQGFKSARITVVGDLADALSRLQVGADKAELVVTKLLGEVAANARADLRDQLSSFLERVVPDHPVSSDWSSSAALEEEGVSLTFKDFAFEPSGGDFKLVQVGPNKIVVQAAIQLTVDAYADFSVSVWDSIDKEYVSLGSTSAQLEDTELETDVLVTFEGDFESGAIEITNAEIVGGDFGVYFDGVEPDFSDNDHDYEEPEDFDVEAPTDEPAADDIPT